MTLTFSIIIVLRMMTLCLTRRGLQNLSICLQATCQSNQNQNPPTRITTNHFEINNGFDMDANNLNLQDCIENSMASSSLRSLKSIKKRSFNPSFWLSQKFKSRAKRIDICARMIFPLVFAIFNTTYWTYYLSVQSYEK